jgi:hypothetical protein
MSIIELVPGPTRQGRATRLSQEDILVLAEAVQAGKVAGDNEPLVKRETAYQRAQAASTRVLAEHGVKARSIVWAVDNDDPNTQYLWGLGPQAKAVAKAK